MRWKEVNIKVNYFLESFILINKFTESLVECAFSTTMKILRYFKYHHSLYASTFCPFLTRKLEHLFMKCQQKGKIEKHSSYFFRSFMSSPEAMLVFLTNLIKQTETQSMFDSECFIRGSESECKMGAKLWFQFQKKYLIK